MTTPPLSWSITIPIKKAASASKAAAGSVSIGKNLPIFLPPPRFPRRTYPNFDAQPVIAVIKALGEAAKDVAPHYSTSSKVATVSEEVLKPCTESETALRDSLREIHQIKNAILTRIEKKMINQEQFPELVETMQDLIGRIQTIEDTLKVDNDENTISKSRIEAIKINNQLQDILKSIPVRSKL